MDVLTGEPLALDLLNTRVETSDGPFDVLDRIDDFQRWLTLQSGRLTPPQVVTGEDLEAVKTLRAHVRTAVEAARQAAPIPDASLQAINDAVRAAPPYTIIGPDRGLTVRRDGDDRTRLLAQLAEAAVALLGDPDVVKIRTCEGPRCIVLFLPAHPRRRWCSPTLCGNRVRVARHYQRRKQA